jgi:YD repeat-containing protein
MSSQIVSRRPTPTIKKVLRACTVAAIVLFILLQVVMRRSRQKPVQVRLKSDAEIAKIAPSRDSYPCLLAERSKESLRVALTTCLPALHNDSAVEEYEVDLRSGRFTLRQTDLFVADSMPLALTRGYRLWDDRPRAFGIGANHAYDIFPYGDRFPYTYMELLLGDGVTVHYDRISEGTSYLDDVKEHRGTGNTAFQNSRIAWNGDHWDLTFRDGSIYRFPEAYYAKRGVDGALVGMRNPQGQEIHFLRDAAHNLKSITSPNGHSIQFAYDGSNRTTRALADVGGSVDYSYDPRGRLVEVGKNGSPVWRYWYDETGMTRVQHGGREDVVVNHYVRGRIASITIGSGRTYHFDYLYGPKGKVVETLVIDPAGNQSVLRF